MLTQLALPFLYQIFTSIYLAMTACCPISHDGWTEREFWKALYLLKACCGMRRYLHVHLTRAEGIEKTRSDQRSTFHLISGEKEAERRPYFSLQLPERRL